MLFSIIHRNLIFLFQNPDIVLVHYLNVPYPDDNKLAVITPSISLWADKKEWTKEELVSQLKPMFFSEEEPDLNNELEISVSDANIKNIRCTTIRWSWSYTISILFT